MYVYFQSSTAHHTKKPDLHHDPFAQAAKEGCLNIVRQAEKAGIKQIVVMSSVVALTSLTPGATIKAPLDRKSVV